MSAQSYRNLKQQVIELVAVNEALSEKIAAFIRDHEATVEGFIKAATEQGEDLAEQVRLKQFHRRRYDEAFALYSEETKRAKRYEQERDEVRQELQNLRWTLIGTEREREAARAHAESMRERAFPTAPQFPWEQGPVVVTEQRRGSWSPS